MAVCGDHDHGAPQALVLAEGACALRGTSGGCVKGFSNEMMGVPTGRGGAPDRNFRNHANQADPIVPGEKP